MGRAADTFSGDRGGVPASGRRRGSGDPVIVAEELSKRYGDVQAVDGISFSVERGEILGFLGHNGAGKTTTVKMLTGRARPTGGRATVAGCDVVTERDRYKPLVNLVPETPNLYERLTARDNLRLFTRLYGVSDTVADDLLDAVGLTADAQRRVKTFSTGMKQRLLLARAFVNRPEILFLDEPTRGLDPVSARDVRGMVRERADEGMTVFLCTHYMEEADELCDRVAFLSEGRIVALDSPRELKLRYGQRTAKVMLQDRTEHEVKLDDAKDAARLQAWMDEGQVLTVHSQEGTLEDVFVATAGREL